MSKIVSFFILFFLIVAIPASGGIIKYVDDHGQVWHVNRIEAVPEQYRGQLSAKEVSRLDIKKKKESNRRLFSAIVKPQVVTQHRFRKMK